MNIGRGRAVERDSARWGIGGAPREEGERRRKTEVNRRCSREEKDGSRWQDDAPSEGRGRKRDRRCRGTRRRGTRGGRAERETGGIGEKERAGERKDGVG